jgi:hypothetical protein
MKTSQTTATTKGFQTMHDWKLLNETASENIALVLASIPSDPVICPKSGLP